MKIVAVTEECVATEINPDRPAAVAFQMSQIVMAMLLRLVSFFH